MADNPIWKCPKGPWTFVKQPDKKGYVNNPNFTEEPHSEDDHAPCGYWLTDEPGEGGGFRFLVRPYTYAQSAKYCIGSGSYTYIGTHSTETAGVGNLSGIYTTCDVWDIACWGGHFVEKAGSCEVFFQIFYNSHPLAGYKYIKNIFPDLKDSFKIGSGVSTDWPAPPEVLLRDYYAKIEYPQRRKIYCMHYENSDDGLKYPDVTKYFWYEDGFEEEFDYEDEVITLEFSHGEGHYGTWKICEHETGHQFQLAEYYNHRELMLQPDTELYNVLWENFPGNVVSGSIGEYYYRVDALFEPIPFDFIIDNNDYTYTRFVGFLYLGRKYTDNPGHILTPEEAYQSTLFLKIRNSSYSHTDTFVLNRGVLTHCKDEEPNNPVDGDWSFDGNYMALNMGNVFNYQSKIFSEADYLAGKIPDVDPPYILNSKGVNPFWKVEKIKNFGLTFDEE